MNINNLITAVADVDRRCLGPKEGLGPKELDGEQVTADAQNLAVSKASA